MIKNYLKIALRSLATNKVSSSINIGGLALGMAVVILIGLWIFDEVSFDKNFDNHDRIAAVLQNQTFNGEIQTWNSQAMQLAPELRSTYGSNFKHVIMAGWTGNHTLTFGDKVFRKPGNYMEPAIADMLSLKMIAGSRDGLQELNSILLSATAAKTFFGEGDALNKVIKIDNRQTVKVAGVYEDIPVNSSFGDLLFIAPWQLMVKTDNLEAKVNWGNSWFQTFVQIADKTDMTTVSAKIKNAKLDKISGTEDQGAKYKPSLFLHPMNKWHLYGEFKNGINVGGRIQYVWIFGIIGVFVLLLACINFMNLSTARSEKRAKEVGIRKAIGSARSQLIGQFFSESFLTVTFACILAVGLAALLLPWFNDIAGKKTVIPWLNPLFWLAAIGFIVFTGFIAGSYPALYLSSFNPVKVLKGTFKAGRLAGIARRVLVVVQFTISITLIIGTMIIYKQVMFAKDRPMGYNTDGLIAVSITSDEIIKHYEVFRRDLLNTGAVEEVAASDSPLTNTYVTNGGFKWQGKDPAMQEEFVTLRVTQEFGKMINWKIKEGRDFSKEFATDTAGFILNESAVKYMGLKEPLGETIQWGKNGFFKVIGVVKDLVTQSPYEPAKQTIFILNHGWMNMVNIKIKPTVSTGTALKKIETVFKKYNPANPFEFKFADQEYAKKFGNEERISRLVGVFAALAIIISCLGLFGLASFIAEQRTKEIGVRKVLGASVFNVWGLLSKEFVMLVIISMLIAIPIAYYFMYGWLQNYQYRTEMNWWVFVMAGAGALIITLLTVSFQSIKAGLMNPVRSLRSE